MAKLKMDLFALGGKSIKTPNQVVRAYMAVCSNLIDPQGCVHTSRRAIVPLLCLTRIVFYRIYYRKMHYISKYNKLYLIFLIIIQIRIDNIFYMNFN